MRSIAALLVAGLPLTAIAAGAFSVTSTEIKPGARIAQAQVYKGFGCEGGNVSPSLEWTNPPAGTKSFAVTVYDPDAPTGSGWWHWLIFNIPANVRSLSAGAGDPASGKAPPGAVQSRTDFGQPGYGGPCPPKGKPHRYVFTVFALKVDRIDAPADANGALVGFMLNANALGIATLTAIYGR
jgi:Raf kinase inhibitor-like YbhB/YbcL family protein